MTERGARARGGACAGSGALGGGACAKSEAGAAGRGLARSSGGPAGRGLCREPGGAATMTAVDLARVGACVLKHAVTGEVRPDGRGRWAFPGTGPGPLAAASGACLRGRVVGRWGALGEGGEAGLWAPARGGCRDWGKAWGAGAHSHWAVVPRRPSPAQAVELRSLWQEQACVVAGLRRFGCMVCRWIAQDLSGLKGLLDQHGVRLVGVGPEALGLQEFLDGGYFAGGASLPPLPHGAGPQPPLAHSRSGHLASPCPALSFSERP